MILNSRVYEYLDYHFYLIIYIVKGRGKEMSNIYCIIP